MISRFSKYQVATFIAILFHAIGLAGILFFNKAWFIYSTPFNLLLMFVLLVWTQAGKNIAFWLFLLACIVTGIAVEVIGVNTGWLFGRYAYGDVLGFKWSNVPLIIGINWFIIIYCCGISIQTLLTRIINMGQNKSKQAANRLKAISIIIDGATLATVFDWLMEPVAISLGYWSWLGDSAIPIFNYVCWFIVSVMLLVVFHFCKFEKKNKFAVNLLLVQLMFFLLLRTFLT